MGWTKPQIEWMELHPDEVTEQPCCICKKVESHDGYSAVPRYRCPDCDTFVFMCQPCDDFYFSDGGRCPPCGTISVER